MSLTGVAQVAPRIANHDFLGLYHSRLKKVMDYDNLTGKWRIGVMEQWIDGG
jgi:hypothetical protein